LVVHGAGEHFPLGGRGKRIEVLIRMAIQLCKSCPKDPPKIEERFFIDLVTMEQLRVVAKVSKKPAEFPKRTFRAVEAPGEGNRFIRGWLQNAEPQCEKRLLRMPAVRSPFYADQEDTVEIGGGRRMARV
jgi:hypothetical protein